MLAKHLSLFKMKAEHTERPVVSLGAVVIKNDCAFIVKRGTNPGKGIWSVPGGKVELGETLQQAVAREALRKPES